MLNIFYSLIAQSAAPQGGFLSSRWGMTVMMVGVIGIFYLLIIRPQNKKKKETDRMLSSLKKGDKIVTIGGLHGKVAAIKDDEIVIKIDANAELTVEKSAVSRVVNQTSEAATKTTKKDQGK